MRLSNFRPIACGAMLLVFFFSGIDLSAQLEWEPVNNGIWGAYVADMTFTKGGEPLITTPHGLYRYESNPKDELQNYQWKRLEKKMMWGELERSTEGRIFCKPFSSVKSYKGLYFSDDGGDTWEQFTWKEFSTFIVLGDKAVAGFLRESTANDDNFHITFDSGKSWQVHKVSIGEKPSKVLYDSALNFYAYTPLSTPHTKFWFSLDTGKSWTNFFIPYKVKQIEVVEPGELLAIMSDGIYYSLDNGRTWNIADTIRADQLVRGTNNTWYARRTVSPIEAGSHYGIFKSTDKGRSWYPFSYHSSMMLSVSPTGDFWSNAWRLIHHSKDGTSWRSESVGLTNVYAEKLIYDYETSILYGLV
ncbi:MAG: WD40/YVTN/BNR-like repeat-containing protein, partial [Candidatus Kapaibacterium sp.]